MANYGQRAIDLLKEFKRSQATELLGPYNEDAIRRIIQEVDELYAEGHRIIDDANRQAPDDPTKKCGLVVHHAAVMRNKRCLLAYLNARLKEIERLRWEFGSILPLHIKSKLSPYEIQFFAGYNQLLNSYMAAARIDLTEDLLPPKELLTEVRCLQDYGEIQTEVGPITLQKNSTYFLKRSDVERLILQGIVEYVHNE